jgi:MFS transporter, PHS family, inorganic phosphate transporter
VQAHIADPNERRRLALAEIDKAPFGWYHVRACVVAGIGFFTDAYDLFAIGLVTNLLGIVYWQDAKTGRGKIPTTADTAIKISTSAGKPQLSSASWRQSNRQTSLLT